MNFFDTILEQWKRSPADRAKVGPATEMVASLRACIPDICRRIENDLAILEFLDEFLRQLLRVSWRDPKVLKDKFQGFCHAHQGKGEKRPVVRVMNLGHVETRKQFQKCLKNQRKSPLVHGGKFLAAPSIIVLLRSTLDEQRSKLGVIKLSRYQMWSFYQPGSRDDPYRDVDTSQAELRRRLGLGKIGDAEPLLFWTHKLSWQMPTIPTGFDAALDEFFQLGGRTQPLSGHDGLWEVVHEPIDGRQLIRAIEVAG